MDQPLFDPNRVMALVGPTGSGKSALALALGRRYPLEIVCLDSMQLYAEPRIGTARPTDEELAALPHHMFGCVSLRERMTTIRYREMAAPILRDIQQRGKIPVLVGGTGLYMRGLFEKMAQLPETPPELRQRLERIRARRGLPWLYRMLRRLDPRGAAHLHPNDSQRISRFLEVRLMSGRGMLTFWDEQGPDDGAKPLTLGLDVPRDLLWQRLAKRAQAWLDQGWIEETRSLMEAGLTDDLLEVGPIGYREICQFLDGKLSHQDMTERIYIATRQYAKRQMTWFRKASYIQWFPFDPKSGYNMECVTDFIEKKWGNRPIQTID